LKRKHAVEPKRKENNMPYSPIKSLPQTDETRALTDLISSELTASCDKFHFSFNGVTRTLSPVAGRILLGPDKKTNDITVKRALHTFAQGQRASPLWSIVLKYDADAWASFMDYARDHEVLFDCLFYSSSRHQYEHRGVFSFWMPHTAEAEIPRTQMVGLNGLLFKKAAIRIVTKADKVIVVIKLLEAGFFHRAPPAQEPEAAQEAAKIENPSPQQLFP
jgi:hypothetical protein